jgi:hypothetical protein
MDKPRDVEWGRIERLIAMDKASAWDDLEPAEFALPPDHPPAKRRTARRLAWAAALLLVILGGGYLLLLPKAGPVTLTLDRLPFFVTMTPPHEPSAESAATTDLGRSLARLLIPLPQTESMALAADPPEKGNSRQARESIRRIIRDNALERFLTRVSTINQEV